MYARGHASCLVCAAGAGPRPDARLASMHDSRLWYVHILSSMMLSWLYNISANYGHAQISYSIQVVSSIFLACMYQHIISIVISKIKYYFIQIN